MSKLLHVTLKDPTNSGYIWREFYCPDCLEKKLESFAWMKVIRRVNATPKHLSTIYPQLVNEPYCRDCGSIFRI